MSPGTYDQISLKGPTENVVEGLQTTEVVVIHPGSSYLRIGRASDAYPITISHCIARRCQNTEVEHQRDPWIDRPECRGAVGQRKQRQGFKELQELLHSRPVTQGHHREPTDFKELCRINENCKPEVSEIKSSTNWSDTSDCPKFLVGEQALFIHPNESYSLHRPIRCGRLNVRPDYSLMAVLQDLQDIWSHAIENLLQIPLKDLQNYKAVVLIPDIFYRIYCREIMNLLLNQIGFGEAFLTQESVCAVFSAGASTACVVDVGDQKSAVCCVEDGLSIKNTRLCMDYGGSDVTRTFHWLLTKSGFPYTQCHLGRIPDAIFLQDLKEEFCHLDQDREAMKETHLQLKRPNANIVKFTVHIGDERILAPLALFSPRVLGIDPEHSWIAESYQSDPTDAQDHDYLIQTMSKHEQAARRLAERRRAGQLGAEGEANSTVGEGLEDSQLEEEEEVELKAPAAKDMREIALRGFIGIDQAILQSIEKCESDELKRRLYSCIIIVGGGLAPFHMSQSWIQYHVWTQMPQNFRLQLETQDIITNPKDMDPRICCWKGAAVMCCLDTAQEMWIKAKEWQKYGVRILREKAPFVWND